MSDQDPLLPPELERAIFEIAAWNDRTTTKTLLLVCQRVRVWIEPCLHRVTVVASAAALTRLMDLIRLRPEQARGSIKHLMLTTSAISRDQTAQILAVCTGTTNLALWTGDTYPEMLSEMHGCTSLKQISVDLRKLFAGSVPSGDLLRPFRGVTHLDVFSSKNGPLIPVFKLFPALTHLAFPIFRVSVIKEVLKTCSATLKILVTARETDYYDDFSVDVGSGGELETEPAFEEDPEEGAIADLRFCVIDSTDFERDWELGAWGGRDVWARAEERVAARTKLRAGAGP